LFEAEEEGAFQFIPAFELGFRNFLTEKGRKDGPDIGSLASVDWIPLKA
jgi:hypothetical protein